MLSKKTLLQRSSLYLILDVSVVERDVLLKVARLAVTAGVEIVQLRDKVSSAKQILAMAKELKGITAGRSLFILNDRVDLGILSDSDGVHLGQEDVSLMQARSMLGDKIVGISCQTLDQAKEAECLGADYIGFGSVFKTQTKPERTPMDLNLLKEVNYQVKIPVFPIGGINLLNVQTLSNMGITRFAVCREICKAQCIEDVVKKFREFSLLV